jgi:hypothetical protein
MPNKPFAVIPRIIAAFVEFDILQHFLKLCGFIETLWVVDSLYLQKRGNLRRLLVSELNVEFIVDEAVFDDVLRMGVHTIDRKAVIGFDVQVISCKTTHFNLQLGTLVQLSQIDYCVER